MALRGESRHLDDTQTLRIDLPHNPEAPSLARAAITGFFEERELDRGTLTTLTLLVSELVSNAVVHSEAPPASEILLHASLLGDDAVRVEVTDRGEGFVPGPHDPSRRGGGYGLYPVDQQATRWGVDREGGSRVWFEIASGHRGR